MTAKTANYLDGFTEYAENVDLRFLANERRENRKSMKAQERDSKILSMNEEFAKIKIFPNPKITVNKHSNGYFPISCWNCNYESSDRNEGNNYYFDLKKTDYSIIQKHAPNACPNLFNSTAESSVTVSTDYEKDAIMRDYVAGCENYDVVNPVKDGTRKYNQAIMWRWIRQFAATFVYRPWRLSSKIFVWLFMKFFVERMIVSSSELECLVEAGKKNLPVVYVLDNRSYFDWFFTFCVLTLCGLKTPVIYLHNSITKIAQMGVIGFQTRSTDPSDGRCTDLKHLLYDEVKLMNLEQNAIIRNHMLIHLNTIFRNRDDETMYTILDMVRRKAVSDIIIVPVSVNIEQKHSLNELPTNEKWSLFKIPVIRNALKMNLIRVNFCKPISIRKVTYSLMERRNEVEDISSDDCLLAAQKITSHIRCDVVSSSPIMTTDLVAFLLLKKFRLSGATIDQLAEEVHKFEVLFGYERIPLGFSGKPVAVVQRALKRLEPYVERKSGSDNIYPNLELPYVSELYEYYAADMMNHFMARAVIYRSLSIVLKDHLPSKFTDEYEHKFYLEDVIEKATVLFDLFQYEYEFVKPCSDVKTAINNEFNTLVEEGYVEKEEQMMTEEEQWAQRQAAKMGDCEFSSDEDEDEDYYELPVPKDKVYLLNRAMRKELLENMELYGGCLSVYIEAYLVCANQLYNLGDNKLSKNKFTEVLKKKMRTMYEEENLQYGESVSAKLIKNALNLLDKREIIKSWTTDDLEYICFKSEDCERTGSQIRGLIAQIEQFKL